MNPSFPAAPVVERAAEPTEANIREQGITEVINLGDCFSGPLTAGKTADRCWS